MVGIDPVDRISAVRNLLEVLRWLGLWKWKSERGSWSLLKRSYRFLLHIPLTFTYVALMWLEALTSDDFEQAGQRLYISLTELGMLIKLINIWYRRDQALLYIDELELDTIYELRNNEEAHFWQREQTIFKRLLYLYVGASLAVGSFGFVGVLFQETYELPFSYYVPFEWRNPERYYYAWGYNVLAMSLTCASNILLDTIGCYILFEIALLYRLISLRLTALQRCPESEATGQMREIFKLHAAVRRLTQQCEILVSPYVLSQIMLSAFVICFSGYRLLYMNWQESPGQFLTTLQFMLVMVVQVYLPCYYGNELTFYANQLTNSVYQTNWLGYSIETRKLLNMYMEFLKRPIKVRAGTFFQIGLPIFVKTINNAYSFFALLLNLSR